MKYNKGVGENLNWIVTEEKFNDKYLGKCESIMCQGNGYLGVRAALEENYENTVRNMFVAGTFNKFDENEVSELPNVADITAMDIEINGEKLNLARGVVTDYYRDLNVKTGMLTREFNWTSTKGDELAFKAERFVSMDNKHLIAQRVTITALNNDISVKVTSGINGQVTNSGSQHFSEGDKRAFELKYIQANFKTTESKIDFVLGCVHKTFKNGTELDQKAVMDMDRRAFYMSYSENLNNGESYTVEKVSNVYTSRDMENEGLELAEIQAKSLDSLKQSQAVSFDTLFENSVKAWEEKVWKNNNIKVDSKNDFDQLAIRFSIYHIYVMSPIHDNRMNIGAKGLSGEGYKGHSFWDTEIFLLPYFTFVNPLGARSLLEHRYKGLDGARKKAKDYKLEGAMYPWETGWITDGEVTPVNGAVDIITGESTKIWSGIIELHITSDVAFGVWQYFEVTGDQDYMDKCGYEIILDTANFWQSRLEWKEENDRYEICGIIGPDEYKEHKNNNAFTNYMAAWNIKKAMDIYEDLSANRKELLEEINTRIDTSAIYKKCCDKVEKIYLPPINEDGLIPQDDTFLSLETIDLTKYKQSDKVGTLFNDYNLDQVNQIQVSKQADTLLLFYLLEKMFDHETKKKNFYYYEDKCLHDSSLSLSTHSVLASDLYENDLAYSLFERACRIDLGEVMTTSDAGIHSASFGGVWQCIAMGFVGIRNLEGNLRISPRLPKEWNSVELNFYYKGILLDVKVTANELTITTDVDNANLEISIFDTTYTLEKTLNINY